MCSIHSCQEDGENVFVTREEETILDNAKCKKCQSEEVRVLLRGRDTYCKACFLTSTTHKFRAAIGKAKIIRRGDSVLVHHSGEANSMVLLHLIRTGMQESTHKKLIFKTSVLYVDAGVLYKQSTEERISRLRKVAQQVEDLGFEGYITSLSESFRDVPNVLPMKSDTIPTEGDENFLRTVSAATDATAEDDLLHILSNKLLISAASLLECNKVFVADSSNDLAVKILSDIAVGRGTQISSNVSFCDPRCSNIMLLRPMRDFSRDEIMHYLNFHNLNVMNSDQTVDQRHEASIKSLTKHFLNSLDTEYRGTVSTVFRTGEKLCTEFSTEQNINDKCVLCKTSLDTIQLDASSAIDATTFSRQISSVGGNTSYINIKENSVNLNCGQQNTDQKNCNKDSCNCANSTNVLLRDIQECLCYGCRLIFHNIQDSDVVPPFLKRDVEKRLSLKKMEKEIADFLL